MLVGGLAVDELNASSLEGLTEHRACRGMGSPLPLLEADDRHVADLRLCRELPDAPSEEIARDHALGGREDDVVHAAAGCISGPERAKLRLIPWL